MLTRVRLAPIRVQLKGLENGYHLMRAFIVDQHGACVKSALGYVEAEFYVVEALPQKDRCVPVAVGAATAFGRGDCAWGLIMVCAAAVATCSASRHCAMCRLVAQC